jgi:hypothetical protein
LRFIRRWTRPLRWDRAALLASTVTLLATAAALALGSSGAEGAAPAPVPGVGDLLALGQGSGQTITPTSLQDPPEPADVATPTTPCAAGSNPLTGYPDGRVPGSVITSGAAANGFTCNLSFVAHQGSSGGFKVFSYTDPAGHMCAYYDTALLFPTNAISLANAPSTGVAVLDMSDPSHPVQTATLTALPMLSPHESLSLNAKRGLLGAVLGNPATLPGDVAFYSLSQDCRHPVLDFTGLLARFGHEGAFSPDGNTFWATATAVPSITAIDVSDPHHPHDVWQGNMISHGLSISDDGDTAYISNPTAGELDTLDVSQIQNRVPNPQVTEISRLTWSNATIPQSSASMQINGHPYLLEFDEYAYSLGRPTPPDTVGAARIIDIADQAHPSVVSNLRLAVDQPAAHKAAAQDPGALSPVQGYAAHYCSIPREIDPEIVACSFINSGLRIFNVADPAHPREVAYYISPPKPASENGAQASDFAMSKPAFDPALREVWYTDGTSGFYVVKLDAAVWPDPVGVPAPTTCVSPSGRLKGGDLGGLSLGEGRRAARVTFDRYKTREHGRVDVYCLSGGRLRAAYASRRLLRRLPHSFQKHLLGRIVIALTSNRFYSLRGITPGTAFSVARRALHPGRGYAVGLNTWYVLPGEGAHGVLKVQSGRVEEIGTVNARLTSTRARSRAFFRSFGR